jgi:hypothetical protein
MHLVAAEEVVSARAPAAAGGPGGPGPLFAALAGPTAPLPALFLQIDQPAAGGRRLCPNAASFQKRNGRTS